MRHKVAIINAVYPPEPMVSAQMGRDLAGHLADSGARVTVLCPYPSRPLGVEHPNFRPSSGARVDCENGLEVVRLPSFRAPQSKLLARMRESFSFGRHVCHYLKQHLKDVDIVYANTWPLLSQALVARHCARRDIPLVLHVQDIYPESLLGKVPRWSRGLTGGALTALDRWIAQRAACVVVISENMRRTYVENRGLASEKVITILNWVDERPFATLPARAEACAHYGILEDRFTFLYLGNIGPVAGVEGLIQAFHAAGLKQAQLVLAGGGSFKAACVELAKRMRVGGVRFVSDPDADNVPKHAAGSPRSRSVVRCRTQHDVCKFANTCCLGVMSQTIRAATLPDPVQLCRWDSGDVAHLLRQTLNVFRFPDPTALRF